MGPTLIGVVGVIGIIITAFFPCDVGCEANPITIAGKGYGVLVAITALLVFIAMVAIYSQTREHASWNPYARYTLVTALLTLGLGLAALTLLNTDYTGLAERVVLLPISLWLIVRALQVWRSILKGPDAYANQI